MIDFDRFSEAIDTLRSNPIRTLLTAVSVSWGIFMLVLLLGSGNGLRNAIQSKFKDDATNSIWIYRGRTSIAHDGNNPGRDIKFYDQDFAAVKSTKGVQNPTGRVYLRGAQLRHKSKSFGFDVRSVHPPHQVIEGTIILQGRFINDLDIEKRRKVTVLGTEVVEILFKNEKPIGKWVEISGAPFKVVGVFTDDGADDEVQKVYIPLTTAQTLFGRGREVDQIMFTVGDMDVSQTYDLEQQLRTDFASRHGFSVKDKSALRIRNNVEGYQKVMSLFTWIRYFVWVVGLGTLVAGVVAVSNIMLISVNDRTREIGLRKALGATPNSIVTQVVLEAFMLTSLAGYAGLVVGAATLEILVRTIPENDYFYAPSVNFGAVMLAALLLVVAGMLAGFVPARRAARIHPVAALRSE